MMMWSGLVCRWWIASKVTEFVGELLSSSVVIALARCAVNRSQVGIGSESDFLLGQPRRIFEISALEAGWKVEQSGSDEDGEGECGGAVADDGSQRQMKFR